MFSQQATNHSPHKLSIVGYQNLDSSVGCLDELEFIEPALLTLRAKESSDFPHVGKSSIDRHAEKARLNGGTT